MWKKFVRVWKEFSPNLENCLCAKSTKKPLFCGQIWKTFCLYLEIILFKREIFFPQTLSDIFVNLKFQDFDKVWSTFGKFFGPKNGNVTSVLSLWELGFLDSKLENNLSISENDSYWFPLLAVSC